LPVVVVHGNSGPQDTSKFKSALKSFSASEIAKFMKEVADGKVMLHLGIV
jgi:hypothetical protein